MTPNVEDFIAPIQSVNNMHVQGIGGTLKVLGKGSVAWNITDDSDVRHKIIIPNTLYVRGLNHHYYPHNIGVRPQMTISQLRKERGRSLMMMN